MELGSWALISAPSILGLLPLLLFIVLALRGVENLSALIISVALTYHTTNRDGYREYKSDPKICANCPTRHLCTHSKDCAKAVQRPGPGIQRVKLKFAAMNLKKLAIWIWMEELAPFILILLWPIYARDPVYT